MKVFAAVYEHRHGSDVRVFKTLDSALAWRTEIALEWWGHEFGDRPQPADPDETTSAYWDSIEDEFFHYEETELED